MKVRRRLLNVVKKAVNEGDISRRLEDNQLAERVYRNLSPFKLRSQEDEKIFCYFFNIAYTNPEIRNRIEKGTAKQWLVDNSFLEIT